MIKKKNVIWTSISDTVIVMLNICPPNGIYLYFYLFNFFNKKKIKGQDFFKCIPQWIVVPLRLLVSIVRKVRKTVVIFAKWYIVRRCLVRKERKTLTFSWIHNKLITHTTPQMHFLHPYHLFRVKNYFFWLIAALPDEFILRQKETIQTLKNCCLNFRKR